MNTVNRAIYCIIDDLRSTHFFKFMERGLLPNFKRLMEHGMYSKNCITDFPAVTYPTQPTMITGSYTGDYRKELCHGIPSYSWMGRYYAPPIMRDYGNPGSDELIQVYKLNSDLMTNCQTFLEMTGEGNHASHTQFISRGTDYMYPETKLKLIVFYELILHARNVKKMAARANTLVVKKLLDTFKRPKKYFGTNEAPIGTNLWFMTSDALMHEYGHDSAMYKVNLMHIDKIFGILIDGLEQMGYLDDTVIAISADHGNYKANRIGCVDPFYEKYGLKPYHPKKHPKGNVNISNFGSVGLFYFKGSEICNNNLGWSVPTLKDLQNYGPKRVNLLEAMFNVDGSELMYYRGEENTHDKGTIHLKRKSPKTGKVISGRIDYKGIGPNYQTKYISENDNKDIFGYSDDDRAASMLDNKFHSIDEWAGATYHLDFPLYPDLIPRHMKNPRSSDIIISTCGNVMYNINHGKVKNDHLYSHDIGRRKSSIVPLIIAGSPDVPQIEIPFCKTTDIVPTLIKMLGKKLHPSVDGKSLI